jgi:hypothetical protein
MKRTLTCLSAAIAGGCIAFATTGCTSTSATGHHGAHERLGKVHFLVQCNVEAQREFDVAMAYYHSFAWQHISEPLQRVLKADPSCGMAHWARTLASLDNPFTWPGSISAATLERGPEMLQTATSTGLKSQRERDYVDALATFFRDHEKVDHRTRAKALEAAMEQVMKRHPQDTEAATLYALILSANFDPADKKYTTQLKAAAILEPIFKQQPEHPGVAHYLIHSYDYPPIAHLGLDAARRYGGIAADAPHALHMPSHIFTRVGAWKESIRSNRASAQSATDKTFDKWHAYDYMVYAHLQLGEDAAARQVVADALANPARIDHVGTAYGYAAMPARLAVERGAWQTAASLPLAPADGFPWAKYPQAESINAYARGLGAALSGDPAGARVEVARLERLRDVAASRKIGYWAEESEIQAGVVRALALCAEGKRPACLDGLRAAANREDASEKHAVTPGRLVPAREVLAYMTLEAGEASTALREFETVLERDPNRLRAFAGASRAAQSVGDKAKANQYAAKVIDLTRTADTPIEEIARAKQMLGK